MLFNSSRRDFLMASALGLFSTGGIITIGAGAQVPFSAHGSSDETITPYQFGAAGNGKVDDTAALQRAVSAAIALESVLDLDRGIYKVTGSITGNGNIRIINSGGATIEAAKGRYEDFGVLVFAGRAGLVGRLATPAVKGTTELRVLGARLVRGDVGVIFDPADFSYSGFRRYYRAGEFFEVSGLADKGLSLSRPLYADYDERAVGVYKVQPITGYVRDIIIKSKGGPESLIVIDYAKEFEIRNPTLSCANNIGIAFSRSIHCMVLNPRIDNFGSGADDYGVVWSNSQHCRLAGGRIYSRRHPVAMGGDDRVNGVPCRDVVIENATLRNDRSTRVHCADIHGNSELCGYSRCVIFGGFSPQGRDNFLRHSTVHAMSIGTAVYAAELLGGEHVIEGNTFYFQSDPSQASRGAIDFGGNNDAITSNTSEALTIVVRRNTFVSSAFSGNTTLLYVRDAGTVNEINIRFADNKLSVNDFSSIIRLRRDHEQARSGYLIMENNLTPARGRRATSSDMIYSGP